MLQGHIFCYPDTHPSTGCALTTNDTSQSSLSKLPTLINQWHSYLVPTNVQQYDTGEEDNISPCNFFFDHILNEAGRQSLIDNIARHISNTKQKSITVHTIANFVSVDPGYSHLVGRKG
jgi:catalase